jgi:hypothetical protein
MWSIVSYSSPLRRALLIDKLARRAGSHASLRLGMPSVVLSPGETRRADEHNTCLPARPHLLSQGRYYDTRPADQLVASVKPSNTLISEAAGLIHEPFAVPPVVQLEVLTSLVVLNTTDPEFERVAKVEAWVQVSDGSPIIPLHFISNPIPAATDVTSSVVELSCEEYGRLTHQTSGVVHFEVFVHEREVPLNGVFEIATPVKDNSSVTSSSPPGEMVPSCIQLHVISTVPMIGSLSRTTFNSPTVSIDCNAVIAAPSTNHSAADAIDAITALSANTVSAIALNI